MAGARLISLTAVSINFVSDIYLFRIMRNSVRPATLRVKILPAVRTTDGFRIAHPGSTKWSNVVHPDRFAERLIKVNNARGGRVVPTGKLAKAMDHPLRTIKMVADEALKRLSLEFDRMYSKVGRASVPPQRLLKASLLISLYSVRSERVFCEELEYNLLFRWFLDMNLMERSFDPTVFTKNRKRLLEHRVGQALFDEVVWEADRRGLLSDEHFSVDRTLIEAVASEDDSKGLEFVSSRCVAKRWSGSLLRSRPRGWPGCWRPPKPRQERQPVV